MRSLRSGLISIAVAGLVATMAIVGCSADGDTGGIDPGTDQDPNEAKLPPAGEAGVVNPPPKKDAGKDAVVDTYVPPPPPNEGDPCTTVDEIFNAPCGKCGKKQAICQNTDGGLRVSAYGGCGNEVGICAPTTTQACGNCGTQTCTNTCNWGACAGQPTNSCVPGSIEYTNAGCGPNTWKNKTCAAGCTWGNFTTVCTQPINEFVLNIPNTANQTASLTVNLAQSRMDKRISAFGTCPLPASSSFTSTTNYPYQFIELKNTNATAKTVTAYFSQATGGAVIDTIMAVYGVPVQPMDDASKRNCTWGVNDQSSSDTALTGNSNFSIVKAIPVPANSSVLVLLATYYDYDPLTPAETTGPIKVNVLTTAVGP